ncbi:lanthionine synthetase C family protein [Paenibacillus massiliensis]|uniref:lanthionine synthetase C family protein n=1 Tax=Paenibacillus massiliensis TaxID=225917 RepID=UPI0009DED2A3|nr:lanthionine synthetase C family protein [Paenibacillus massiliensis]
MTEKGWIILKSTIVSHQGVEISKIIAKRLQDIEHIQYVLGRKYNQSLSRGQAEWSMSSLADGLPGVILLFSEWSKVEPDSDWGEYIYNILIFLHRHNSILMPDISLFSGTTGIAYALRVAAEATGGYSTIIRQLNDHILSVLENWLQSMHVRPSKLNEADLSQYDVISGFSGIGRYLLEADADPRAQKIAELLVADISHFVNSCVLPFFFDRAMPCNNNQLPLGIAHGIGGMLCFLLLSYKRNIQVPGLLETIQCLTECMSQQVQEDRFGLYWPETISSLNQPDCSSNNIGRTIEGWCHGSLGMALTIWRAGECLHEEKYKELSVKVAYSAFQFRERELELFPPTFCHGLSGLLYLSNLFYRHTSNIDAQYFAEQVATRLVNMYEKSFPYGYKDWDVGRETDNIGLLQGASGIALSLLDFGLNSVDIKWHEPFLVY